MQDFGGWMHPLSEHLIRAPGSGLSDGGSGLSDCGSGLSDGGSGLTDCVSGPSDGGSGQTDSAIAILHTLQQYSISGL